MKKIIPVALIAVAFGLVGCAKNRSGTTPVESTAVTIEQPSKKCNKCKGKKCRGKLGVERNEQDFAK